MSDGPEGFVSGLIWEERHKAVPENAMVLKIEVIGPHEDMPFGLIANVEEGSETLQGEQLNIVPKAWNSCIGLGRLNGYIVVENEPTRFDAAPDTDFFMALAYLPDPADRSRGFERENNWFIPGKQAPELRIPATE
ncbi:hypothetical protein [Erythrobacter sp. F6033]|uniref:hypothetical protein n=1 Tax=Erythrobacter sp. F6033 TaxID=2926401 RepID=UPI001FF27C2A|nr:hypothetical protein [Erythrobacter sp. F6033]MCK0127282.1 hypothetical protein [Erythrobacter sp. F6033]